MFSISYLFSGGIIISSTFLEFSSVTSFDFTSSSAILFTVNSPIASAVLWITFWDLFIKHLVLFKASNHVAVSSNCFAYLLDRFLANDKTPYPWTYCFALWNIILSVFNNKQCQINFLAFYIYRSAILICKIYYFIKLSHQTQ